MKLVLINPKFPESFWSFSWVHQNVMTEKRTINSPLGLATLAALSPQDWDIEIIDENIEPIDWSVQADIIGVCGMGVQMERQKEILNHFKGKGSYVVAGGSYASLCPEEYEGLADSVIAGESEYIWPQFCEDFLAGRPKTLYQETGNVNLHDSPCPRYDLLKLDRYQRISVQFSRGCPFMCEFCDIIVMFGRTPRNKNMAQIETELEVLRKLGVKQVFFVDDNFIGNKKLAKDLLRFLSEYQEKHNHPFNFGTEASINMADDDQMLALFRQASFEWVFIGIESPSEESLMETKKVQNVKGSLLEKIQKIYSSGINIFAGFIVGFDADDITIFERQYRFIESSGITVSMIGLLTAIPKTPLFKRLKAEGRLKDYETKDNTRVMTNVIPKQMTEQELVDGYVNLHHRLLDEKSIHQKIANKAPYFANPTKSSDFGIKTKLIYFGRILFKGIFRGGPRRVYYFTRSMLLGLKNPRVINLIIEEWVSALSLKSYADRYLFKPHTLGEKTDEHFQQSLVQKIRGKVKEEVLCKISNWQGREKILIEIRDTIDKVVVKVLAKSLKQYFRRGQGSIVLDFRGIKESGLSNLKDLLLRLEKYGHQIQVYLSQGTYQKFRQELSAFHFTLITVAP